MEAIIPQPLILPIIYKPRCWVREAVRYFAIFFFLLSLCPFLQKIKGDCILHLFSIIPSFSASGNNHSNMEIHFARVLICTSFFFYCLVFFFFMIPNTTPGRVLRKPIFLVPVSLWFLFHLEFPSRKGMSTSLSGLGNTVTTSTSVFHGLRSFASVPVL